MNMEGWLQEETTEHRSSGFIYFHTMLALASGLTYIHREIDTMVGYHRDIKPSNILLFHSNDEKIWKFCDFGTSNLKPADNTGTTSMVTDKYWAPPEFFEEHTEEDGLKHARAHDVFSLGCVFIELATLLHMGADGRSTFKSRREDGDRDPEASWYRGAFHRSMPVVREWIEDMRNKQEEGQHREVLAIIFDMLQTPDERIYSWEVEIDLFIIGPSGTDSEKVVDYLRQISQSSLGYRAKTKRNPYTRAKRRARENHLYSVRCLNQFFQVMNSFGWHEYSPQSTGSSQQTPGQQAYSNLPLPLDRDTLCGGQGLYQEISNGFRKSDIVALYGVAGIGKSRNACEYAGQFVYPEDKAITRHTFFVDATTADSLMSSYDAIADKINLSEVDITGQSQAFSRVTRYSLGSWLNQEKSGKWFMVVDGFDPIGDMTELKQMLPTPRHGMDQILITTRNLAKIREYYSSCKLQIACIEVTALSPADSMRLFKQNIGEWERLKGDETDTPKIKDLLEKLWSPLMIKYAANQIGDTRVTVMQLKELVDDNGLSEVTVPFESYLTHVLEPLTGTLSHTPSWPRVVGTLFLLAFFDPNGVKWSTLKNDHTKRSKRSGLLRSLGKLEDYALINKAPGEVYSINGNIRETILEWIEQLDGPEGGAEGLLKRHSKALSIIYKSYQSLLANAMETSPNAYSQLHQAEQPFMPHFECFLNFTKKHTRQQKPELRYPAVRAVICFSKVLLDKDRYEEAMRVTEYTREHFQHKLGEADSEKQVRVFFILGRHLITIYLAHPRDAESSTFQSKARDLIAQLQSVVQEIKKQHLGWDWLTTISLEIKLDQARLYRESEQFDDAHRELSSIGVTIEKKISNGDKVTKQVHKRKTSGYRNTRRPEHHPSLPKLRIMSKFQDGLLHMTEGDSKYSINQSDALAFWYKARGLLLSAVDAAETYCPTDESWHEEIRVAIAVVNTKIGQKSLVNDAIDALNLVRGRMEERYGLVRRTMDVEFKLNEARLKSSKQHVVKVATDSSREIFHWYKDHFGEYATDTKDCASQLVRARIRVGETDMEDMRAFIKYYGLEKEAEDMGNLWRRRLCIVSFLCILLMTLCLVYRY
ncbi:SPS1 Serine-threonine protein kinase [Pyrenophora tritici-repentis]|nr:SPS1 Serine-threonine protein kinase [Pyrenophora tritici-repentis]KAI0606998.1 SPS1 Serine-threonine protein kinase [Pyrenophora tritici-repentis]KAI0618761.1 SPS1 Serine-threonine protein kinase [Pyrenophora tritici-repentis]